ncbi:hypothetical protein [Arthrobacter sp. UYEF21]|uniref:hypothetical protein n=1 Tax=Arthrobacter sp. UYEF21 TaxID=1756364 RepID=UPI00339B0B52
MSRKPELPAEAQLAQAPLQTYDVVEVSLFDHPVGRDESVSAVDSLWLRRAARRAGRGTVRM